MLLVAGQASFCGPTALPKHMRISFTHRFLADLKELATMHVVIFGMYLFYIIILVRSDLSNLPCTTFLTCL